MAFLEARKVCRYFKAGTKAEVRALDDVSFTIERGSLSVVVGPSGSGKTTLLALLGALDRPTRGQVIWDGTELSHCSDSQLARLRRRIGFVFQNFSLIPKLPLWENVTYPLIPRGVRRARRYQLAQSLLGQFGMLDKLLADPGELSAGEQQRAALARALAGEPEVILADEPTANLDAASAGTVQALLQEMHTQGKTVVIASHDPRLVAVATAIFELEGGRLKKGG